MSENPEITVALIKDGVKFGLGLRFSHDGNRIVNSALARAFLRNIQMSLFGAGLIDWPFEGYAMFYRENGDGFHPIGDDEWNEARQIVSKSMKSKTA